MKHLKKFNESNSYPDVMKVSVDDLMYFVRNYENPNYPGFEYDSDTSSGRYHSEKGAMYDYPIYLSNGKETWESVGGYYTGITGEVHNSDLIFTKIKNKQNDIKNSSIKFAREIFDFCKIDIENLDEEYIETLSEMILKWYKENL